MTPLLNDIVKLTENAEASEVSYLWAGISGLAACASRNVYIPFGDGSIYPNLYCMFIGEPGTRKSTAIKAIKKLVKGSGFSKFCADKVTMQKYIGDLAGVVDKGDEAGGTDWDVSSILELDLTTIGSHVDSYICQDEFSDFIGINNYPFVSLLGNFWDIDEPYAYRLKNGKSAEMPTPNVNILGATTPSQFHTIFPPAISEQGFLSRLILINIPKSTRLVSRPLPSDQAAKDRVVEGYKRMKDLKGAMVVSEEVWTMWDEIYKSWVPIDDSRFAHYGTRRHTQLLKLCTLMALSRFSLTITPDDVVKANSLLCYTEHYMPTALGQFGKQRDSDVSHKILQALAESYPEPLSIPDLYGKVSTEIGFQECTKLLMSLHVAGKTVSLTDGGIMIKRSNFKDSKVKHIDWTYIDILLPKQ